LHEYDEIDEFLDLPIPACVPFGFQKEPTNNYWNFNQQFRSGADRVNIKCGSDFAWYQLIFNLQDDINYELMEKAYAHTSTWRSKITRNIFHLFLQVLIGYRRKRTAANLLMMGADDDDYESRYGHNRLVHALLQDDTLIWKFGFPVDPELDTAFNITSFESSPISSSRLSPPLPRSLLLEYVRSSYTEETEADQIYKTRITSTRLSCDTFLVRDSY
jgi:hypothetical protein